MGKQNDGRDGGGGGGGVFYTIFYNGELFSKKLSQCLLLCVNLGMEDCIAPADISQCQNGGRCRINLLTDSISCMCTPDFIGEYCDQSKLTHAYVIHHSRISPCRVYCISIVCACYRN